MMEAGLSSFARRLSYRQAENAYATIDLAVDANGEIV